MIEPFPKSLLNTEYRRLRERRIPVTVCVAAMCATNILIGASDRMLTAGDVEFEPETAKIYSVTNSAVVMIAGEASLQSDILQRLYMFAADRIKERPQEWVPIVDLAGEYQKIYQDIKSQKAETRVCKTTRTHARHVPKTAE
jgi:hypothetical protein